jgi:nitroimidazol reductase NimA-like FMN-containing flavoprotein (pyridoxamine 5'-phosphate oxidase superfamily)
LRGNPPNEDLRIDTVTGPDPTTDANSGEVALSDAECRRLLETETIGRVGLTTGGLPCILPVCYVFHDDRIRFRTARGTKLRAAESGDVLAFEVDHFDGETAHGWSVLVLGRATVYGHGDGAAGGKDHLVSLRCEIVSGRAVQLAT